MHEHGRSQSRENRDVYRLSHFRHFFEKLKMPSTDFLWLSFVFELQSHFENFGFLGTYFLLSNNFENVNTDLYRFFYVEFSGVVRFPLRAVILI